jgi:16S rRNA (guanine(966)-N(2))-methyltransferase RsmD
MRLSGGEFKGRRLPVKGLGLTTRHGALRATSSKVRESIFNILGDKIKGSVFVDLYSGTGGVGFEAMSRGAEKVCFVEADTRRAAEIKDLLSGCGCRKSAHIVRESAVDFLQKSGFEDGTFNIVFLDPPYNSEEIDVVLPLLGQSVLLADDAVVIAEHFRKKYLPEEYGVLRKGKTYRYGDTVLTLYRKH